MTSPRRSLELPSASIAGLLPTSIGNDLRFLEVLDLDSCNLKGSIPPSFANLTRLIRLNLRYNYILGQLPPSFSNFKQLQFFDLSSNQLDGQIPDDFANLTQLFHLSLTGNQLSGNLPLSVFNLANIVFLDLSENKLVGSLPSQVTGLSLLSELYLSGNFLNGRIPPWLFTQLPSLTRLVLDNNKFSGPIDPFNQPAASLLEQVYLQNNEIHGLIPSSVFALVNLTGLDISSNRLTGISEPNIKILPKLNKLDSLDLSNNTLLSFKSGSNASYVLAPNLVFLDIEPYYHDSVEITMKGAEFQLERILTIFTAIDMSSNRFGGEISEIIGELVSLQVLNFSHNNLTGRIPSSIGNLTQLESLDVSSNKLTGRIPTQMTALGFLAVLNLSENRLVVPIPVGKQFSTFSNDSYIRNPGLCGFPLSKTCGIVPTEAEAPHSHDDKAESVFEWKAALMGYGSGLVFGISAAYIMLTLGTPFWLVKMLEEATYKFKTYFTARARGPRNL